ncbi:368_t:CDS:2, partial [Gigaspora rosea]
MIDAHTKAYLDTTIQTTAASVIQTMKQYMDQQMEIQRMEYTVNSGRTTRAQQPKQSQQQNEECGQAKSTGGNLGQIEGNYPPTPIINNLIMKAVQKHRAAKKQE